jgi:hypothetical protein
MQPNSMAQKVKILMDGEEIPGLVKLGEISLEKGMIDVPGFQRIYKISTGVTTMPSIPATFETRRNTSTRKTLNDWYNKNEQHDVTIIWCDAGGVEFARDLWEDVECSVIKKPETDLANVTYARLEVTFLPYDITSVE